MNIERETNNHDTQAPHGTYEFLERIGSYLFIDPINKRKVWVVKEPVCAETGGSCMDLTIREEVGGKKDRHGHITQDARIVRLNTYLWNSTMTRFEEGPTPDIKDMLSDVKKLLSLSRKDIDRYPW